MVESTLKTELEAARDRLAEILEAHDDGGADLSHSIRTAIAHINHALRDLSADADADADVESEPAPEVEARYEPEPHE